MSVEKLSAFEKKVLAGLSHRSSIAASLFGSWADLPETLVQTDQSLIGYAQLGVTEEAAAHEVLQKSVELQIIKKVTTGFLPISGTHCHFKRLALALNAIDYYASKIRQDETIANIVLTKPPKPSNLEKKLSEFGWKTTELETTARAFQSMVLTAKQRVVVMTPFFDEKGSLWLKELFSLTKPGVERILILRSLEDRDRNDYPEGYDLISKWLKENSVRIFNYSLPKIAGRGRETFHAKVILSDRIAVYIGSSNMTEASLQHSMELGVALCGRAAADAAIVLDAVISTAVECTST